MGMKIENANREWIVKSNSKGKGQKDNITSTHWNIIDSWLHRQQYQHHAPFES